MAYKNGTMVFFGWKGAYGRTVDIDHGNGLTTRYAHLKAIRFKRGGRVSKDHAVGLLGRSGRATGNNLHFEVMVNGRPSDPRRHVTDASALLRKDVRGG
jgi:murein DD-endopeptidase MepM/ murein hydrolase activator NlpD